MKQLIYTYFFFGLTLTGYGQGKFFGGDGPSTYSGGSLLIGTPLYVEFTEVNAKQNGNKIVIDWSTASELNNDFFEVERSNKGTFESIGLVQGMGTTSSEQYYTFSDKSPQEGMNYYRLKQVDFDGTIDYSDVVLASFISGDLIIYPNPTEGVIYLNNEIDGAHLSLFDQTGSKVNFNLFSKTLDISFLPSGLYLLQIDLVDQRFHFRVMKI